MKNLNLFALFIVIWLFFDVHNILGESGKETVEPVDKSSSVNTQSLLIPEIKGNFKFDGLIDDACWDSIVRLPFVMHIPTFGIEPSERSEVFICHDNSFIYVAGRFFDKEADKITIASKMRDNIGPQEDGFLIIFDSFHDHENAVGFRTNAAGVRQDFTIANDGTDAFSMERNLEYFLGCQIHKERKGMVYRNAYSPLESAV